MKATVTAKTIIPSENGNRKYYPGDVAEADHAAIIVNAGAGHEIKSNDKPSNKAKAAPKNKSA